VLFLQLRVQSKPILEEKLLQIGEKLYLEISNLSQFSAENIIITIRYFNEDLEREEVFHLNYLNPCEKVKIPLNISKDLKKQKIDIEITYNPIFLIKYIIKDSYLIETGNEIIISSKRDGLTIEKTG
jgi:hypothetical protein